MNEEFDPYMGTDEYQTITQMVEIARKVLNMKRELSDMQREISDMKHEMFQSIEEYRHLSTNTLLGSAHMGVVPFYDMGNYLEQYLNIPRSEPDSLPIGPVIAFDNENDQEIFDAFERYYDNPINDDGDTYCHELFSRIKETDHNWAAIFASIVEDNISCEIPNNDGVTALDVLLSTANECQNDVDFISQEDFTPDSLYDPNVILILFVTDYSANLFCFEKEFFIRWVSTNDHIMSRWVDAVDDTGRRGHPDMENFYVSAPNAYWFHVQGRRDRYSQFMRSLADHRVFVAIMTEKNVPIGNMAGQMGVSMLHGNNPQNVYRLYPLDITRSVPSRPPQRSSSRSRSRSPSRSRSRSPQRSPSRSSRRSSIPLLRPTSPRWSRASPGFGGFGYR